MELQRLLSLTRKAMDDYQMIQEGDKIAVGISGGKDSLTLLYAMANLRRFYPKKFSLIAITVDLGYEGFDLTPVKLLCEHLQVEYHIVSTEIAKIIFSDKNEASPCSLCAKMRKGALNDMAEQLGCNKIALGHHFDDVIETTLMGMLYSGKVETMMPKLHSIHFEGMELIRPMYLIREDDIKHWRDYNDLHFIQCACRFTDTCTTCRTDGSSPSKRMEIKNLIASLKQTNPFIEGNIFKSVENVNLRTIIAYKEDGVKHHFLEHYDEWK
mgnify:CR=1 FL=1